MSRKDLRRQIIWRMDINTNDVVNDIDRGLLGLLIRKVLHWVLDFIGRLLLRHWHWVNKYRSKSLTDIDVPVYAVMMK